MGSKHLVSNNKKCKFEVKNLYISSQKIKKQDLSKNITIILTNQHMRQDQFLVNKMINELTIEQISGNHDLEYLLEIGGIETVKNHFRNNFPASVELRLPALRQMPKIWEDHIKDSLNGLDVPRMAARLGYTTKSMHNITTRLRKKATREMFENQAKMF